MGEAKRKSQSHQEIIEKEPRCIYCPRPAESVEHMPPRGMFRGRQRPGGMEYGVCHACNNGTRGPDAVAALMALLHPNNLEGTWQAEKDRKLFGAIDAHAPGVREELSLPQKSYVEWAPRLGSGLLHDSPGLDCGPRWTDI
jgi:hypothetical protein